MTLDQLRRSPETDWFQLGYDLYSFGDAESYRKLLNADRTGLEVLAFIGVWCPDCQEHLPAFARIWETAQLAPSALKIYDLDRGKTFIGGEALIARHRIERLPTFVFLRSGQEIGRITETPTTTLLADMARIVLK